MQKNANKITEPPEPTQEPDDYLDMNNCSGHFGIRARVQLENRVLEEYREVDPNLGYDAIGTIFSVLSYHQGLGDLLRQDRMTVCLVRRATGRVVEVDFAVNYNGERDGYCLKFAGERELGSDER
jgi:hypothetical protein